MRRARAEVLGNRALGRYRSLTLVAPDIAERANPGQFVALAMPAERSRLLRRHAPIHQASRRGGWAGTLELVIGSDEPTTSWLAELEPHGSLDVIGPLGRGFAYPKRPTRCLLVAEGRGAAPLYFLAQELVARGKRVDMVVGGATQEAVLKPIEAKRLAQTVAIVTADGSLGERGGVLDVLAEAVARTRAQVLYAAASVATLASIAAFCRERRLPAQVAIDEPWACGLGLCFGCPVPVARPDGSGVEHLRACVDGPVFDPAWVRWDRRVAAGVG